MEAIEYGLSTLIASLWKKDVQQWKAIYPTNTCLFLYFRTRSELLRDPNRLREEEQSYSCILRNCCSFSWFNEWQSFSSTKKGHRSKFASAVLPTLPCWKQSSINEGLLGTALFFCRTLRTPGWGGGGDLTNFGGKGTPFIYLLLRKGTPLTYLP